MPGHLQRRRLEVGALRMAARGRQRSPRGAGCLLRRAAASPRRFPAGHRSCALKPPVSTSTTTGRKPRKRSARSSWAARGGARGRSAQPDSASPSKHSGGRAIHEQVAASGARQIPSARPGRGPSPFLRTAELRSTWIQGRGGRHEAPQEARSQDVVTLVFDRALHDVGDVRFQLLVEILVHGKRPDPLAAIRGPPRSAARSGPRGS